MKKIHFLILVLLISLTTLTSCKKKYTVVFKDYNDSILKEEIVKKGSDAIAPLNLNRDGYNFIGWDKNYTNIQNNTIVVAKYEAIEYKISYELNGGTLENENPTTFTIEDSFDLSNPKIDGCTFIGWYKNPEFTGDKVDKIAIGTIGNLKLWAKYDINKYTLTFDTDGGNLIESITQEYNTLITKPVNPEKEGYTFIGWDKEIPQTMPSENVTVKAIWQINSYTITFHTDGGNLIESITQEYNTSITKPVNPEKEGYTFIGWDKEIPQTMPSENVTLKAIWQINSYTITFDTDGGNTIDSINAVYNEVVKLPVLEKEGYIFNGWIYNGELYKEEVIVKSDMILSPDLTIITYTITVNLCNDKEDVIFKLEFGETLKNINIALIPSYEGYRFNELYYDSEYKNIVKYRKAITEDITIYVKWDKIYYIEYNLNDGYTDIDLPAEYIEEDVKYLDLEFKNPKKDGYYFRGWYESPNFEGNRCYKIDNTTVKDYVLYAKWDVANLENAYLGIIGDSISTYQGYIPSGHIHFPEYSTTGSVSVNQTWWKKTVNDLGCRLGVNNSYSGTCVMSQYGAYTSSETLQRLRKSMRTDNIPPDIIVVFMGMNDCLIENVSTTQFEKSYRNMINNLKQLYPEAVLFFATISYEYNYESKGEEALKAHLESKEIMNNTIRSLAKEYNYPTIEFASAFDSKEYLLDTVHPNYKGMAKLAEVATKTIKEYYEK